MFNPVRWTISYVAVLAAAVAAGVDLTAASGCFRPGVQGHGPGSVWARSQRAQYLFEQGMRRVLDIWDYDGTG